MLKEAPGRWSFQEITSLREQTNLTQEEAAAFLGISVQTLSHWERGMQRPTTAGLSRLDAFKEAYQDEQLSWVQVSVMSSDGNPLKLRKRFEGRYVRVQIGQVISGLLLVSEEFYWHSHASEVAFAEMT